MSAGSVTRVGARRAGAEFGGVEQIKERYRDQQVALRRWLIHDVHGMRCADCRNPGFTTVAVLTLALGIGANTAIFTLLNAVLLKPLPVNAPGRLAVFTVFAPSGWLEDSFSYPFYEQVRDTAHAFSGIAASGGISNLRVTAIGSGASAESEMVIGEKVTGNFFSVLDVEPLLGRTFTSADDQRGSASPMIVLSHAFWKRWFDSDPSVVGRQVTLNELPFTVLGVMPPGFFGFEVGRSPDLWWSLQMMPRLMPGTQPLMTQPGSTWLRLIGRLGSDVSLGQAQAEVEVMFQRDLADRARIRGQRLGSAFTPSARSAFLNRSISLQPGRTGHTRLRYEFLQPWSS